MEYKIIFNKSEIEDAINSFKISDLKRENKQLKNKIKKLLKLIDNIKR